MSRAVLSLLMASLAAALAAGAEDFPSRRLLAAVARGDAAEVAVALREGADPDASDRSGWTGLHQAAETGDLALARLLLENGAHADLRSRARGTPLDIAERAGRTEVASVLRAHGARGSGKSIGDTVCVRPWQGDGFCAVVEGVDPTRFRLRISRVIGCAGGCPREASCSAGQTVGPGGLSPGDVLWVPASCLTHTGMR